MAGPSDRDIATINNVVKNPRSHDNLYAAGVAIKQQGGSITGVDFGDHHSNSSLFEGFKIGE